MTRQTADGWDDSIYRARQRDVLADWLERCWSTREAAWLFAGACPELSEGPHPEQMGGIWKLPGLEYPDDRGAWWFFEREFMARVNWIEGRLAGLLPGGFGSRHPAAKVLAVALKNDIVPPWRVEACGDPECAKLLPSVYFLGEKAGARSAARVQATINARSDKRREKTVARQNAANREIAKMCKDGMRGLDQFRRRGGVGFFWGPLAEQVMMRARKEDHGLATSPEAWIPQVKKAVADQMAKLSAVSETAE